MRTLSLLSIRLFMVMACTATLVSCRNSELHLVEDGGSSHIIMRLRMDNNSTLERVDSTIEIIRENPGCCDEVWFSSGLRTPSLDKHRETADLIAHGIKELKKMGIRGSIQVQMTIGHGDHHGAEAESDFSDMTWTGWTGSTGVVDQFCNCPSQKEFLKYMYEVSLIYAGAHPYSMWIDDDLRFDNHKPATDGSRIGCWCDTCIADFNKLHSSNWTRESLDKAMNSSPELEKQWREFSIGTLANVARTVAKGFHEVSPETKAGFQHGAGRVDCNSTILKAMYEESGHKVGYRCGANGEYYDWDDLCGQIRKSIRAAEYQKAMGDPDYVDLWVPEIESWPRVYGSRSAQGIIIEGFTAIAFGMNGISYFTMAAEKESFSLYSRDMLHPISLAAPVLHSYIRANEGTIGVGYTVDGGDGQEFETGRLGLPILKGVGKSLGHLGSDDIQTDPRKTPSSEVQKMVISAAILK